VDVLADFPFIIFEWAQPSSAIEKVVVASPHRGEMFIAVDPFFSLKLRRSEIAFAASAIVPLPGFAPKGARTLGVCS
jgi:hypothetical protein